MSGTILALDKVDAFYGPVQALRGVSLSVRQGQVVALLGANGAGKSTALRAISGLVRCAAGRIAFLDQDITRMPAHRLPAMGLIHVPEGRRIFKGMTIRENLELGAFTLDDTAERNRRLEHVFTLFSVLKEREHRDSANLSGGEQQMLAIGRALMADPKLLLLDEPSMGLAPRLVREVMTTIARLHDAGTTILLVEQNARLALRIADYGYVLENGSILVEGDAATLRQDDAVVRAYLGGT